MTKVLVERADEEKSLHHRGHKEHKGFGGGRWVKKRESQTPVVFVGKLLILLRGIPVTDLPIPGVFAGMLLIPWDRLGF
jgi:hypothetical protein